MRFRSLNAPLFAVVAVLAGASAACSDFIRQDRSPVTLIIDRLEAAHLERACSLQEPWLQRLQLAAACDVQHDDAILLPPQEDAVFPADS